MDINGITNRIFQERMLPYETNRCEGRYVSDALAGEIEGWIKRPVLINAPTGAGKSRFILKDLAKHAENNGRWILVLSNRIALNMQQKMDLCREKKLPIFGTKILADCQVFGNVVLCTYQSSGQFINTFTNCNNQYRQNGVSAQVRQEPGQFLPCPYSPPQFVVFDEAHFFCSDAIFNAQTEAIFDRLLNMFYSSVRIYMSATPEDVKPVIAAKEFALAECLSSIDQVQHLYSISGKNYISEYCFSDNHRNISLHFFYEWKTIENVIKEKDNSDKWLVFVNRKDEGKAMRKELSEKTAEFIDASRDTPKAKIRTLTRKQFFERKVLIATSVIDNGISICDDDLKNIVVDFSDEIQLIQMLGRKRVKEGEHINVFVRVPSILEIREYQRNAERLIDALHLFEKDPIKFLTNIGVV